LVVSTASSPLAFADMVVTNLNYLDGNAARCSPDLELHRAAYNLSGYRELLSCLPPYALTLASTAASVGPFPVLVQEGPHTLPHLRSASSALVLRGRCALAGSEDPAGCLDLIVALETAARAQIEKAHGKASVNR